MTGIFLASNLREDSRIAVVDVRPYNPDFAGTRGALNVMMARGDGQGLAILARDPLMHRSPLPKADTAYLAQRPFVSLVAWAISLGDRDRVPLGIAVSSVLGGAVATLGLALLFAQYGKSPWWGLLVALLPGAIADVPNGAAEAWGLGFALIALALWPQRRFAAAGSLAVAALCRETYLVVPAALVLWELSRRRVAWPMLAPPAVYLAWAGVVHARAGAWPWTSHAGKLDAPLRGIIHAAGSWGTETFPNIVTLALMLVIVVHPIIKGGWMRVQALGYLALALLLGVDVWGRWENFSRVLLPLYAIGVASLVINWRGSPSAVVEGP